jgi:signal transduction histidine kinase
VGPARTDLLDHARIAAEQAALRRVALLVAQDPSSEEVFASVSEEAASVLGSEEAGIFRFDGDNAVAVGRWGVNADEVLPVGTAIPLPPDGAMIRVRDTAETVRFNAFDDVRGQTADLIRSTGLQASVAAPILVDGRVWGTLALGTFSPEPFPEDTEERLVAFAELVSVAIAGALTREQLLASRARLVQAADVERRKLERNLHDGAQQRLVTLSIALRLARTLLEQDPQRVAELLDGAIADAAQANDELREIARGLHPALLTQRGLHAALRSLARRSPVPVSLSAPDERLPEHVEVAAYYMVAESLTNVAKHARASRIDVSVQRNGTHVIATVTDDGSGRADEAGGTGLSGLRDRVEALRGRLDVVSVPGVGTTVRAELPV